MGKVKEYFHDEIVKDQKKHHDHIMEIFHKVKNGTASFTEKTIFRMEQKKYRKLNKTSIILSIKA